VANLSKTLRVNFYQNRSSTVEVMIKKILVCFFMSHSVVMYILVHCFLQRFSSVDRPDTRVVSAETRVVNM